MGFAKIKGPLTSRIGCDVNFGTPQDTNKYDSHAEQGKIVDEIWVDEAINNLPPRDQPRGIQDWGDYSFCAQLIKWDTGEYTIRLAYYRRRVREDFWEYASQTTVNAEWHIMKALIEKTLCKDGWLRDDPYYPNKVN